MVLNRAPASECSISPAEESTTRTNPDRWKLTGPGCFSEKTSLGCGENSGKSSRTGFGVRNRPKTTPKSSRNGRNQRSGESTTKYRPDHSQPAGTGCFVEGNSLGCGENSGKSPRTVFSPRNRPKTTPEFIEIHQNQRPGEPSTKCGQNRSEPAGTGCFVEGNSLGRGENSGGNPWSVFSVRNRPKTTLKTAKIRQNQRTGEPSTK